jgi:hypothetical protein
VASGRGLSLVSLGLGERIKPGTVVVSTEAVEVAFVAAYTAALKDQVDDGSYARIVPRYLAP